MSNIILASSSPQRIELLRSIIPDFDVISANIDETLLPGETAIAATQRLAIAKARASHRAGASTLGVDTLGDLDGQPLGKPRDKDAAREMLFGMSGKMHTAITSWCLKTDKEEIIGHDSTQVTFRLISFGEIEAYLAMHDPTKYAAGYAIQGAGRDFVEEIDGDIETIIGLPLLQIQTALSALRAL